MSAISTAIACHIRDVKQGKMVAPDDSLDEDSLDASDDEHLIGDVDSRLDFLDASTWWSGNTAPQVGLFSSTHLNAHTSTQTHTFQNYSDGCRS